MERSWPPTSGTGKILVFRDDGSPPLSLGGFPSAPILGFLAFTPAGDAVLGWSPNETEVPIRMVSVGDGRELRTFSPRLPGGSRAAGGALGEAGRARRRHA